MLDNSPGAKHTGTPIFQAVLLVTRDQFVSEKNSVKIACDFSYSFLTEMQYFWDTFDNGYINYVFDNAYIFKYIY